MKTFAVWGVAGATIAVVYAYVSFFLLVPALRGEPLSLLDYAIQGLIFGLAYPGLMAISRRLAGPSKRSTAINVVCGGMSGLLSVSFAVLNTLAGAFGRPQNVVLDEVKRSVLLRLAEFSVGSVAIGMLVGLLIGLWGTRPQQRQE